MLKIAYKVSFSPVSTSRRYLTFMQKGLTWGMLRLIEDVTSPFGSNRVMILFFHRGTA